LTATKKEILPQRAQRAAEVDVFVSDLCELLRFSAVKKNLKLALNYVENHLSFS
jgi:hypothetical protein